MKRREYLEVDFNADGLPPTWGDSTRRSGSLSKGDFSDRISNELGAQGWELAGVAANTSGSYRLFFKRPRV